MRAVLQVVLAIGLAPAIALAEPSVEAETGAAPPACLAGVVAGPVRAEALPRDPAIREAWAQVAAQAPCAAYWFGQWSFSVPKEEVAAALAASLETLQHAARSQENVELLLALGLAGRYGHNVDVDGAAELGLAALRRAVKRHPSDRRAAWTLGGSLCHAAHLVEGWAQLTRVLRASKEGSLPAAFWRDYEFCANGAAMPANALRAAVELERLGVASSFDRAVAKTVRSWRQSPPENLPFETGAGWSRTEEPGGRAVLTSFLLGVRLHVAADAPTKVSQWKDGGASVMGYLQPIPGRRTQVHPGVWVVVQTAGEEPLETFAASGIPSVRPAEGSLPCPAQRCLVLEGRKPGAYDETGEGDGLVVAVAFERDEPAFPGVAFEEPRDDQLTQVVKGEGGDDNPSGLAVKPFWHSPRVPGTLRYLVVLDTAESVEPAARKAFERFLQELAVD